MKKIIGFATKYYTLWNYEEEQTFISDAYGNSHSTGSIHRYAYIKNVSTDIQKVKEQYPNIEIDESLRGRTQSFSYTTKNDYPLGYFWFGKYQGKLIDDIVESDFEYCIWAAQNTDVADQIKKHPKCAAHFLAIEKQQQAGEKERQAQFENCTPIVVGNQKITFRSNAKWKRYVNKKPEYYARAECNGIDLTVYLLDGKEVNGMYPYVMPVIYGKARRVKNKEIEVSVIKVEPIEGHHHPMQNIWIK